MTPSLKDNIKKIIEIEKLVWVDKKAMENSYLNPEKYLWVKKTNWPRETYSTLSKVSGISAFPDKHIKNWLAVIKSGGKGFKKRIGLFFKLPLQSAQSLPISPDFYFNKDNFGILIYSKKENPSVIKFVQTNDEESRIKLRNEVKSQKIANLINHTNVSTACLNDFHEDLDLIFFQQELLLGKDLHALPAQKINELFSSVFEFMFLFYKQNEVSLVSVDDNEYTQNDIVKNYIVNLDFGNEIIKKYIKIINQNKEILFGRVHGDLCPNNILIDKNYKIWIIDWGNSNEEYLAKDFKSCRNNADFLYDKIVKHYNLDKNQLYTLEEQMFIDDYLEISKLIYKHIVKKVNQPYFFSKINSCIERLSTNI